MLDMKMIEQGRFQSRNETFSTSETFQFILDIFQLQAVQQNTSLTFQTVTAPLSMTGSQNPGSISLLQGLSSGNLETEMAG